MKRKLDNNDVPSPVDQPDMAATNTSTAAKPAATFAEFGLDPRLLQACSKQNFQKPTLVQSKAIPLILEHGADVLAKAKTGTGKTAAYLLPILQAVLRRKQV